MTLKDIQNCRANALTQNWNNYAQLGLQDKDCKNKGLVVCNNWDILPFEALSLGCYQPSPEV